VSMTVMNYSTQTDYAAMDGVSCGRQEPSAWLVPSQKITFMKPAKKTLGGIDIPEALSVAVRADVPAIPNLLP